MVAAELARERLEFGFMLYPYPPPSTWPGLGRLAAAADRSGYYAVFFPEHVLPPGDGAAHLGNDCWPDSLTLAAYMASCTERLRFVPGISVLPYHPPVQYAKQLATLDQLTGGRLILGVGAGWYEEEFRRLGVPFEERSAITDEYLRAMIELWTAERPGFAGRYVSFEDVVFEPKPRQRPHIPLLFGGSGRIPARRVVELGAGWYPMTGTTADRKRQFAELRAAADRAGRDGAALWLVGNCYMSINPAQQQASEHVAAGRAAERSGAQSTAELVAQVAEQVDMGAGLVIVHTAWESLDDLSDSLRRFSEDVMPEFR